MTALPKAFIAAASWLSLLFLLTTMPLARSLAGYTGPRPVPAYVKVTWLIVFAFALFVVISLWRLRPIGLWLSVALAGLFGAATLARLPGIIVNGVLPVILPFHVIFAAVNFTCAWSLSRPRLLSILERRRLERMGPPPTREPSG
jgi:hypothetical protein